MKDLLNAANSWRLSQDYIRSCVARTVVVGAIPVFAFALSVGTGGHSTSEFFQARGEVGYRNPYIMLRSAETISIVGPTQNLNLVIRVLQLSNTELARTLSVSRQTVYNWLEGENISLENAEKLANLASIAELFADFDDKKIKELLRRKLNGKTVLELVAQGHSAATFAKQLISISAREESQRDRLAQRLQGKPIKENWLDQYAIPHLSEEG